MHAQLKCANLVESIQDLEERRIKKVKVEEVKNKASKYLCTYIIHTYVCKVKN